LIGAVQATAAVAPLVSSGALTGSTTKTLQPLPYWLSIQARPQEQRAVERSEDVRPCDRK